MRTCFIILKVLDFAYTYVCSRMWAREEPHATFRKNYNGKAKQKVGGTEPRAPRVPTVPYRDWIQLDRTFFRKWRELLG
ncbi:hypothetical protein PUN28_002866 [Cardiocondyla obscurior]|uniref:Secreted protein n=1 Tax=Cardiocondyla obscurior TaxID=286306 RepID=A0AAW2GWM7_9HYME